MPPTADHYLRIEPWTACFDTDYGLRVYVTGDVSCPDPVAVEATARRALQRTGGDLADIFGTRIVFVPTFIWADGREVAAFSLVSLTQSDVMLTSRAGEQASLLHELGHVVHFRRRGNGDGEHRDCRYWAVLEGRDCGVWR